MQAKTATTRVRAGIGYALDEATKKRHCGLPVDERRPLAAERLEVDKTWFAPRSTSSGLFAGEGGIPRQG